MVCAHQKHSKMALCATGIFMPGEVTAPKCYHQAQVFHELNPLKIEPLQDAFAFYSSPSKPSPLTPPRSTRLGAAHRPPSEDEDEVAICDGQFISLGIPFHEHSLHMQSNSSTFGIALSWRRVFEKRENLVRKFPVMLLWTPLGSLQEFLSGPTHDLCVFSRFGPRSDTSSSWLSSSFCFSSTASSGPGST